MSGIWYAPFERKLREPFRYGSRELRCRQGFLLRTGDGPLSLVAEASPLPGHSQDTIEQVAAALEGRGPKTAALEFALSCLDRPDAGSHEIHTNCLVPWLGQRESERAVEAYLRRGFTHCKLKINPENLEGVVALIASFPEARFRLDANQSLNPNLLARFLRSVENEDLFSSIDYLEEPYEGFWKERHPHPGVSYAADESAATALLSTHNRPSVLILKPTVQGSLYRLEELLSTLKTMGIRAVITSAIECEPGRRAILRFLSQREHEVAGVSTGFLFEESFIPDEPSLSLIPAPTSEETAWVSSLAWQESAL